MLPLNFIVTDKCNITCDFCAPNCGPLQRAHLSVNTMQEVFERVHTLGRVPVVVFTGGEPLLYRRDIVAVLQYIRARSDTPTRIVTNAFWARTPEAAYETVLELRNAGLTELNYSVDDFHQAYIPLSNIKYGVEAALELKVPILLAHKTFPGSKSDREFYCSLLGRPVPYLKDVLPGERKRELLTISSGNTIPVGRGSENVSIEEWVPSEWPQSRWSGPCQEVLRTITISANGYLSPCCGLVSRDLQMFYVASVIKYDVIDVLEYANRTVLYNWLALCGPSGLKEYIEEREPSLKFTGRYVQNCQLCQEIFSDQAKAELVLDALPSVAVQLDLKRTMYEGQRGALSDKLREQRAKSQKRNETCESSP